MEFQLIYFLNVAIMSCIYIVWMLFEIIEMSALDDYMDMIVQRRIKP